MAHHTDRAHRTGNGTTNQLCIEGIDAAITDLAAMALIAGEGAEDFPIATVTHSWSSYGTGYHYEAIPEDDTHPAYLVRRRIFLLLSDPELNLIGRALRPFEQFHTQIVLEDAASRLSEMLEWQVMRPASDGGLSLRMAASTRTSVVGWARKFLLGPNGAGKVASRVANRRGATNVAIPDEPTHVAFRCDIDGSSRSEPFDLEAIATREISGNEVANIIRSRARTLRRNQRGCPRRRAAEAAVVRESFNLPCLSTAGLDRDVASVLLDLVIAQPPLAIRALNEHARRSAGMAATAEIPEKLVRLWADYSRRDILIVRALDRGETWMQLLACAALFEAANRAPRRKTGRRSSQG